MENISLTFKGLKHLPGWFVAIIVLQSVCMTRGCYCTWKKGYTSVWKRHTCKNCDGNQGRPRSNLALAHDQKTLHCIRAAPRRQNKISFYFTDKAHKLWIQNSFQTLPKTQPLLGWAWIDTTPQSTVSPSFFCHGLKTVIFAPFSNCLCQIVILRLTLLDAFVWFSLFRCLI